MDAGALKSFIGYGPEDHFPLENIPFGVFLDASQGMKPTCCTRIGSQLVNLAALFPFLQKAGPLFGGLTKNVFESETLNEFAALGTNYR
jgi:fumarylacetoacetase